MIDFFFNDGMWEFCGMWLEYDGVVEVWFEFEEDFKEVMGIMEM